MIRTFLNAVLGTSSPPPANDSDLAETLPPSSASMSDVDLLEPSPSSLRAPPSPVFASDIACYMALAGRCESDVS